MFLQKAVPTLLQLDVGDGVNGRFEAEIVGGGGDMRRSPTRLACRTGVRRTRAHPAASQRVGVLPVSAWTSVDLRLWRDRLGWTQERAAQAMPYHYEAYKKLECGTRKITPRVRKLCLLLEREQVRARFSVSGQHGRLQVFAEPSTVVARMEALSRDGGLQTAAGRRLRYVSVFSGIEAATAAFERLGSDAVPVAFSETDAAANAVLRHRWPDVPRVGDIRGFDWSELRGHVNLVVGGPPCQSFSVAGRRLGLTDPRGNLALHMLRAIGAIKPRWFILENVPGVLSANGGDDFGILLDTVEELGFSCAWTVLDANDFGLPQNRARLFIVGEHAGDAHGPESVLDIRTGTGGPAFEGLTAWKAPARRAAAGADAVTPRVNADWSDRGAWQNSVAADACNREIGSRSRDAVRKGRRPRRVSAAPGVAETPAPSVAAAFADDRVVFAASMRNGTLNEICPTILTRANSLNSNPCLLEFRDGKPALRRFTPRECLRLQGFDDDWLDGPTLSGKPLSDTDRYRLAGNSWAVPVAAWLLERLSAYHSAHPR